MILASMTDGHELFWGFAFVAMLGCGIWVMYMMTCRPDDWMKLRKQEDEMAEKRQERMKKAAGGAVKAGMLIGKLFKK